MHSEALIAGPYTAFAVLLAKLRESATCEIGVAMLYLHTAPLHFISKRCQTVSRAAPAHSPKTHEAHVRVLLSHQAQVALGCSGNCYGCCCPPNCLQRACC
jgi:hypothetical protein